MVRVLSLFSRLGEMVTTLLLGADMKLRQLSASSSSATT